MAGSRSGAHNGALVHPSAQREAAGAAVKGRLASLVCHARLFLCEMGMILVPGCGDQMETSWHSVRP